ncbi:MAG: nucleoid-associated protein [Bacteroidetes bacterium]|nr:nucleoid-associated protein [Bacteroidota bacterium]MBL0138588.1 nucleoid-associated protein [Bacteroidota bacterium]
MLDYSTCSLNKVAVHQVGNKTNDEELVLSKALLDISDEKLNQLLISFFFHSFTSPEYYSFTFSNDDFTLNPLYTYASSVFENPKVLHRESIHIAKHLFEQSNNAQIKSGDLFVAYISEVVVEDEVTDVIGIFKSESKNTFLRVDNKQGEFRIKAQDGINVEKLDKGCLIFNTHKDDGYKICIIDKANKAVEAQFWKERFLVLKPCQDNFHQTKQFMDIAKNFVAKQLPEEFEVGKTEQIDLLNRSVEYFKTHESFSKKEFEKEVFQEPELIKSFRNYDKSYREENTIELTDTFEISTQAVKKQSKIFKSVLKLDKNFHIYIHGDKELIERGVEKDGRKYYKIYYKEEA